MKDAVLRLRGHFAGEDSWKKRFWQQDYEGCSFPLWFFSQRCQVFCNVVLGLVFVGFGAAHVAIQRSVFELVIPYDHSTDRHDFTLDVDWSGPIFVYYEVDNFHAPYKTFVESKDHFIVGSSFSKYNCKGAETRAQALKIRPGDETFVKFTNGKAMHELRGNMSAEGVLARLSASDSSFFASQIRPCGMAAFSVLLDHFELYRRLNVSEVGTQEEKVLLNETDLALDGDRELFSKKITHRKDGSPMVDEEPIFLWGDSQAEEAALLEHFMVWYRGSSSSHFRNLWARIPGGLSKGMYSLTFHNHSDVWTKWGVNKKIVLTTMTVLGANNEIMGVAFILAGLAMLSAGFAFQLTESQAENVSNLSPQTKEALLLIARRRHQKHTAAGTQKVTEVTPVVHKIYPQHEASD
eukprot:gnl/MRDRNA2_/MRDRNA2_96484_c0_seq1.p1 gnl/MRDRNA2_/MRDRNA2_96484_c0~~gnl/MRDRNA2_/MRDRNA2_96484_c0_seq1.p1  ORF type:complete len:408 (-),score=73.58 gnl/MRDRNA2_/MRDRNA2_96484_c0_seq1:486-1709(-)